MHPKRLALYAELLRKVGDPPQWMALSDDEHWLLVSLGREAQKHGLTPQDVLREMEGISYDDL